MAILTPVDLASYAPGASLDPSQVLPAIVKAQMIVEGPAGAHRPLEKQSFIETPQVGGNAIARLSRLPIDPTVDPVVQIRGRRTSSYFGVGTNANDWLTLDKDVDYEIDFDLGEIQFRNASFNNGSNFSVYGGVSSSARGYGVGIRPSRPKQTIELKVTYTTGFDFQANPLSYEAEQIKAAMGAILEVQQSGLSSGVKQLTYNDFVSVNLSSDLIGMSTSKTGKTPIEDYLEIFRQYRPRSFV